MTSGPRSMEPGGSPVRPTRMISSLSPWRAAALAAVAVLALAGCGSQGVTTVTDNSDRPAPPAAVPAASGKVTGLGMVMDSGEGASICLGPIGESYPPSCEGTPLAGWDWSTVEGFEHISGVKFGMYAVTGTWDGTTLTVTDPAISAALYDPAPDPNQMLTVSTRCDAPEGGWAVTDPAKANANALERAQAVAAKQDGFVTSWTDQFVEVAIPEYTEDPDPDMGDDGAIGPLPLVLNVLVTGDVDAATSAIAKVWSGALCVTEPDHDPADLDAIVSELGDVPGVDSAAVVNDRVVVSRLFDDGSLQDYADEVYGEGAVVVTPALRPLG